MYFNGVIIDWLMMSVDECFKKICDCVDEYWLSIKNNVG